MKKLLLYIYFIISLFSCKDPYNYNVDSDKQFLVVDGLITDQKAQYNVKLSYALPYDASITSVPAKGAKVVITDQNGVMYQLEESSYIQGSYLTNPSEFTGVTGNEYTLSIITSNGDTYKSAPQILLSNESPIDAYTEKGIKNVREDNFYRTKEGARVFFKFNSIDNTIPRFRFKATHLYGCIVAMGTYWWYVWHFFAYTSDFTISGEKYTISSDQITNHEVCFLEYERKADFLNFSPRKITDDSVTLVPSPKPPFISEYIMKTILYITKYRLNDDSYAYYQAVDKQLRAENKIFDPINPQVIGNLTCTSDPDKKVLGFFEASPVEYLAYEVHFDWWTANSTLSPTVYFAPKPYQGASFDKPGFWGND